ncbi:hypothetical protein VTJ83DRAFT_5168 [Remersonia thermophila]|uniref:DNA-directed RNA polymerase III subunit n=1 Tax=Remersonia thermophila TaxID=72144 RepID=A0ABR4DDK1_9PEZI
MSGRGGRGGGRGRGGPMVNGRRAVAQNSVPWATDAEILLDGKPSELFPPYDVPRPPPLTRKEDKLVSYFLLFREQCQDGPLYTQARSRLSQPSPSAAAAGPSSSSSAASSLAPGARAYGQDQINQRYGLVSKATLDAFTAVPTYSQRFTRAPRALPDLASRPFAKEFFPPELHATLDGDDDDAAAGGRPGKRRRLAGAGAKTLGLSSITSYKTAEELFFRDGLAPDQPPRQGGRAKAADGELDKALQLMSTLEKRGEGDDDAGFLSGEDDEDWVRGGHGGDDDEDGAAAADEDDQYEDESGDDYNAEAYFDGNQDDDDFDDGGDDGGDYF